MFEQQQGVPNPALFHQVDERLLKIKSDGVIHPAQKDDVNDSHYAPVLLYEYLRSFFLPFDACFAIIQLYDSLLQIRDIDLATCECSPCATNCNASHCRRSGDGYLCHGERNPAD